ncbi:MAG: hypothetical protein KBE91_00325 [Bacteroidia bacterium]|nr:hypothetical protein [Bacteroidia bacterium]MBP9688025.1 hypothetical protein [Bacteroidia bacterium]
MSNAIQAVDALINSFDENKELASAITTVLESNETFLFKLKNFDNHFAKHPSHANIQEYAFDLMMVHHLDNNNDDEEYFESKEWQDIEDKTLDRGTELLNMLLYVTEVNDDDVQINIEDFLYEFLLVDEDEFQDEHRIYEELIANVDLIDENINSIVEVAKRLPDELEIRELFVPLMLFFKNPEAREVNPAYFENITREEYALLTALLTYAN